MNRITPDEVITAFRSLRLRPVRGRWLTTDGRAHGLIAVALYRGCDIAQLTSDLTLTKLARLLGLSLDYVEGWVWAWDRGPRPSDFLLARLEFQLGAHDGADSWRAVSKLIEGVI